MIPARRRGIAVAALFLSLLLVAPNLFADTGSAPRSPEAQVDALFSGIAGKEAPGASVLVIQSGRVMLSKSYGFANLEHRVPNAPETKFRLASVTKPFTAIAILQLREAGRLDLDAPIGRYLPNVPHGDRITVRHLLNHTSGLGNSGSDPLQFSPGERVNYTNEGYRLLGRIVESVSGGSWEEYLKEHILVPLAMTSTGCDHPEQVLSHRASGYVFDAKGGYLNEPSEDIFKTAWAAGALYSTVEDLARLDQALVSGTLLKPATLAQAFAPTTLADGTQAPVGLGWMSREVREQEEVDEVEPVGDAPRPPREQLRPRARPGEHLRSDQDDQPQVEPRPEEVGRGARADLAAGTFVRRVWHDLLRSPRPQPTPWPDSSLRFAAGGRRPAGA